MLLHRFSFSPWNKLFHRRGKWSSGYTGRKCWHLRQGRQGRRPFRRWHLSWGSPDEPGALQIQRPSGENNPAICEKKKRVWLKCEPGKMSGYEMVVFNRMLASENKALICSQCCIHGAQHAAWHAVGAPYFWLSLVGRLGQFVWDGQPKPWP